MLFENVKGEEEMWHEYTLWHFTKRFTDITKQEHKIILIWYSLKTDMLQQRKKKDSKYVFPSSLNYYLYYLLAVVYFYTDVIY